MIENNKNIPALFCLAFFISISSPTPINLEDTEGPGMGIRLSKDGFNLLVNSLLLPWIFK